MASTSNPPKSPGRQRSYDPVQTRKAIIKASLKLFKRNGYFSTAVKDIANEAGVTKGAFYHHFETKEDILLLIHQDYLDYQLEAIRVVIESGGRTKDRLVGIISCILEALGKYHESVTIFFQERRFLSGPKFEEVRQKREKLEDSFHALIEEGIANGEFRPDLDVPVTCLALIGMCAWSYQWYSPRGRLKLDLVSRIFANLALEGVANHN
jgi:AcrR family transcriptional regulator